MTSKRHPDGRVAVITGGAGGLGRFFAQRLAQDGLDIAIADLADASDTVRLVEATGRRAVALGCDLADAAAISAFARDVLERLGRVDVLVNNAAYMPVVPLDELSGEGLQRFLAVNTVGSFLMAKAFLPGMRERRWGRIVNLVSSSAWAPPPHFTGYITSKMANVGLTRALAGELGDQGITVNALAPGLTRTDAAVEHLPPFVWEAVKATQLIHRNEEPQDLMGALSFLCSEDAAFVTGQTLHVDGGAVL